MRIGTLAVRCNPSTRGRVIETRTGVEVGGGVAVAEGVEVAAGGNVGVADGRRVGVDVAVGEGVKVGVDVGVDVATGKIAISDVAANTPDCQAANNKIATGTNNILRKRTNMPAAYLSPRESSST